MRKIIVSLAALVGGACLSSATVTVQGWWHLDSSQPITDSSGNNRTFGSAYSTAPPTGGQFGGLLVNNGAGGPLGGTGYSSLQCVQVGVGVGGKRQSAMWGIGYVPPATNYGIEIWVLPQDNGIAGGSGGWIFSSGDGGGVAMRVNAPGGGNSYIDAFIIGSGATIGNQVLLDTNRWMHLAVVNDNGVLTFYTNGIPCGASVSNGVSAPSGTVYIGTPSDNQAYYGYLDEARMFTFAPGAFTTNDLLLRPAGPNIIGQPQNAVVWAGGAAPFAVNASFDNSLVYQWQRSATNLPGQTTANLYLNVVNPPDSASPFDCILTGSSISKTTSVATLTVVQNNPSNVSAYRNAVNAEPSLLAYFPADGDTGATLTNTKDGTHNGALELGATYDGRTNRTFGARALSFNLDGDVQIPNNPALEFTNGFGTIEALIYLGQATVSDPTIFAEVADGTPNPYYALGVSANGTSLIYKNDAAGQLSWIVPGGLIGVYSHVALVFDNGTNVTAYVNGQNLGTHTQPSFGSAPGNPTWIGGLGTSATDGRWLGSVDELAVYGSALSQNTVQIHYSKFVYGTNTSAPSIVSQPASRTVLAGACPVLVVKAAGTLPLSYQWSSNSVPISGATTAALALSNTTATATYSLSIQNAYGTTNIQPIVLSVAAPPAGYPTMVMNDHPTAFWRLSDGSGQPAVDSAGFNDGAYNASGVTYGVPAHQGESGGAVQLDGSSGRAIVPLTAVLNPSGPFTCEFWALANPAAFYVPVGSMDRPGRSGGYEFYLTGNYPGYEFHTAAGGGYNMITGDDKAPPTNMWFQVVGVYDGSSNIYCYVNGAPAATATGNPGFSDSWVTEGTPPFAPNSVKGFYIGSRADNVRFFKGAISDVAFYNYMLSDNQISNHWSSAFFPATIVTQPTGATNVEFSTVTLTAVVTGLPNTYQWYQGATPLTALNNFDGTPHYAQDVTNATLVIAEAHPSDSGQYHVVVSNPLGGATSLSVTVLITADTNPPVVTAVTALGTPPAPAPVAGAGPNPPYVVKVTFNKRIDENTGITQGNYVLSPAVTVNSVFLPSSTQAAAFGGDWRTAFLQTPGLTPGTKYSLTVSGVKDQAQTPNTVATTTKYFRAPLLTPGVLEWDYYYPVTPQGVGSLIAAPNFPFGPDTNGNTTIFDTSQITGGDLNNVPGFGSAGDNYGDSLSGWITPTVSGQYYFFLASDDSSELYLSSDASPSNAVSIAVETGCCHGFQEPGAPTTSSLISLSAGTAYFIQALHTEGGGGDYVKVAWRSSTDSTPATNLPPIAAQFLSGYAPVPPPKFTSTSLSGGTLTIHWTGYQGVLLQSSNLTTWTLVPGNPNPLVINVSAAPKQFYRIQQ
jgi:hypothetical protein